MDGVGFGQRLFAILLREASKPRKSAVSNMVMPPGLQSRQPNQSAQGPKRGNAPQAGAAKKARNALAVSSGNSSEKKCPPSTTLPLTSSAQPRHSARGPPASAYQLPSPP
jgi:hypothetical protein